MKGVKVYMFGKERCALVFLQWIEYWVLWGRVSVCSNTLQEDIFHVVP